MLARQLTCTPGLFRCRFFLSSSLPQVMRSKRYPEAFKSEAVEENVDRAHSVSSIETRLNFTPPSRYTWIKTHGPDSSTNKWHSEAQAESRRLQNKPKRITDERDRLKHRGILHEAVRLMDVFTGDNFCSRPVRLLCRVGNAHPIWFYI